MSVRVQNISHAYLSSHHLSGLPQSDLNRYLDTDYPDQGQDTMEDMEDGENECLFPGPGKEEGERELERYRPHIPIVLPRRKFSGARNVETVKDGRVDRHILLEDS